MENQLKDHVGDLIFNCQIFRDVLQELDKHMRSLAVEPESWSATVDGVFEAYLAGVSTSISAFAANTVFLTPDMPSLIWMTKR